VARLRNARACSLSTTSSSGRRVNGARSSGHSQLSPAPLLDGGLRHLRRAPAPVEDTWADELQARGRRARAASSWSRLRLGRRQGPGAGVRPGSTGGGSTPACAAAGPRGGPGAGAPKPLAPGAAAQAPGRQVRCPARCTAQQARAARAHANPVLGRRPGRTARAGRRPRRSCSARRLAGCRRRRPPPPAATLTARGRLRSSAATRLGSRACAWASPPLLATLPVLQRKPGNAVRGARRLPPAHRRLPGAAACRAWGVACSGHSTP